MSRNRIPNEPAGTGMAMSSVRCGFPFARDTPSLAPSGSWFACLGGGALRLLCFSGCEFTITHPTG